MINWLILSALIEIKYILKIPFMKVDQFTIDFIYLKSVKHPDHETFFYWSFSMRPHIQDHPFKRSSYLL